MGEREPSSLPLSAETPGIDASSGPALHPPQGSRSSDAMGPQYLLALFLLPLVLGIEVEGTPAPQEDESMSPTLFYQMQESLLGYWDTAKTAALGLSDVGKTLREMCSKSAEAMTTYAGIFTDQVFSVLKADQ